MIMVLIVTISAPAAAQKKFDISDLDFNISVDFFAKYIFRGMNRVNEPVLQPNLSVNYGGITGCAWGNMDMTDVNGHEFDFTEYNYFLEYSSNLSGIQVAGLEIIGFTIGAVHYDYPGSDTANTTEAYWGLDFDLPADPYLKAYHDLDEADGTYAVVGIGHEMDKITESELGDVGMNVGLSVGMGTSHYNEYYWGLHQEKMTDLKFSLALPIEKKGWILTPSLNYVHSSATTSRPPGCTIPTAIMFSSA